MKKNETIDKDLTYLYDSKREEIFACRPILVGEDKALAEICKASLYLKNEHFYLEDMDGHNKTERYGEIKEYNTDYGTYIEVCSTSYHKPFTLSYLWNILPNSLKQSLDCGNDSYTNLEKYVMAIMERKNGSYSQPHILKKSGFGYNYSEVNELFQKLSTKKESFQMFLNLYYPDIVAFQNIFSELRFLETARIPMDDAHELVEDYARLNTETLNQLSLKPKFIK